jgi:hypothetical protein
LYNQAADESLAVGHHRFSGAAGARLTNLAPRAMPFGLVFLDEGGAVWTVQINQSAGAGASRSLVFCRPSFFDPAERRSLEQVPDCWPECSDEELRALLGSAR